MGKEDDDRGRGTGAYRCFSYRLESTSRSSA